MSRAYEVKLIVRTAKPLDGNQTVGLEGMFREQWDSGAILECDGEYWIRGTGALCAGEEEREAHDRFVEYVAEIVPDCDVETIWWFLEREPDEYFESEVKNGQTV